ncbi:MAG TPA: hypothetical protein DD789_10175, partial [Firmicutes bacterium]|nr:hypothetical protein [Bacillota bacterium]
MPRTDVVPVEREDTIQALVGKMRESPSPRIIIFSPTRALFLRSEINLRLLKYYSEEENKELVLVVKDRTVKKIATKLGLQVVDRLELEEPEKPEVYQNHLPMELEELTT